jgi:ribosomal protein S19
MRDYKLNMPHPRLFSRISTFNFSTDKPIFFRSTLLTEDFLGKKAFVYDGHQFRFIFVKPDHLFYPIGSFIFTKKTGIRIHTTKAKKDKKLSINFY